MASRVRSIHIFLNDGEPEGLRSASIPLRSIVGIAFRDVQLAKAKQVFDSEMGRTGVYVLLGQDIDGKPAAYIGESENIAERLQYHAGKKPSIEWSEALAFVSTDGILTKGHVRFAEAELIQAARQNPHWAVHNDKHPSSVGKLPKPDEYFMSEFVEQVRTLAGALGCALFKAVSGKPQQGALFSLPPTDAAGADVTPEFRLAGAGYEARAVVYLATGEFSVLKGSAAKKEESLTIPDSARSLRGQLQADGVLEATADALVFKHYGFQSTSAAAGVVSGYSMAGPTSWRLACDPSVTYKQWLQEQQGSAGA